MSTIETAVRVASEAHYGQTDECGQPFLLHPLRVMAAVDGESARIVAILHDVLRDSRVLEADLRREGFDDEVLEALQCLNRRESEPYKSYIVRCRLNDLARKVKLADLEDNLRPSRFVFMPDTPEPAFVVLRRYFLSYKYLTGLMSCDHFSAIMEGARGGGK